MTKKFVTDVHMTGDGRLSYLGSVGGILEASGMWQDDFYKLAGMTGMAFQFTVHNAACPSSVTVYDWQQEHLAMMDRIGVHSETFQCVYDPTLNTFDLIQEEAVQRIKASIDRGMGVVVWTPTPLLEFGLIQGYDDQTGNFLVQDCRCGSEPTPLPYAHLGMSEVPILFYQIFYQKIQVPVQKVIRDSLAYGVSQWEKEYQINPQYASGRKGYQNLINYLAENGEASFGLAYIIFSYTKSKEHLYRYLEYCALTDPKLQGLTKAADLYRQVAENYQQLEKLVPFTGPQSAPAGQVDPQVLELVKDSFQLEAEAMEMIKAAI